MFDGMSFSSTVSNATNMVVMGNFTGLVLPTSSNDLSCPKTFEIYLSYPLDPLFEISNTFKLVNSAEIRLDGAILSINTSVAILKDFKLKIGTADGSWTSPTRTLEQSCSPITFLSTQALFMTNPVILQVPLAESPSVLDAATFEHEVLSNN